MNRGGAEMRMLDLMRALPPNRFELAFCALLGKRGELDEEIRALGGEVHYCRLKQVRFPLEFRRLLRNGHYDIVHSHVHYFSGAILLLAHWCGVPGRIAHFRSSRDGGRRTLRRRLQTLITKRWIARHATRILAVGHGAMEASWGTDWAQDPRCMVIPNGLQTSPFRAMPDPGAIRRSLGLPEGCTLITHVGRMSPPKNNARLADLVAVLLARHRDYCALFVGRENESLKRVMIQRLQQAGVMDRVCFAGPRNDVPQLLLASDLYLFPSLWEGLPGTVLEACAAGTPVLASDIPGVRELAALFPRIHMMDLATSDHDWAGLAERILATKTTPDQRRLALEAFRRTPYDIESCMQAHVLVWEKCREGRLHS